MASNSFRANVAMVVTDGNGNVMLFRRTGTQDGWQFPQGGIDPGESPEDAMYRELEEETALGRDQVKLVAHMPAWLGYEVPGGFRGHHLGQAQRWYLLRAKKKQVPNLKRACHREFDEWTLTTPHEAISRVVDFKRPVYELALGYFAPLLRSL